MLEESQGVTNAACIRHPLSRLGTVKLTDLRAYSVPCTLPKLLIRR